MTSQLTVDRPRRDFAVAPLFDPQGEPDRRVSDASLNLAQPAATLGAKAEDDGELFKREVALGACRGEGHGAGYSDHLNIPSSRHIQIASTDAKRGCSHDLNMAVPDMPDWYLREWFATMGLKQRDLVTKLDYQPAAAHALWHSVQRYRRDHIADISALLNIQPYELLMPPEEAMALRRLRSVIAEAAAPLPKPDDAAQAPTAHKRTGTNG